MTLDEYEKAIAPPAPRRMMLSDVPKGVYFIILQNDDGCIYKMLSSRRYQRITEGKYSYPIGSSWIINNTYDKLCEIEIVDYKEKK